MRSSTFQAATGATVFEDQNMNIEKRQGTHAQKATFLLGRMHQLLVYVKRTRMEKLNCAVAREIQSRKGSDNSK